MGEGQVRSDGRVSRITLIALPFLALIVAAGLALSLRKGLIVRREAQLPAAFSETFYVSGRPLKDRWDGLGLDGRRVYLRAYERFPTLDDCLESATASPNVPRLLNWRAMGGETEIEVCLYHLALGAGSPEAVAEWFGREGFEVSQSGEGRTLPSRYGVEARKRFPDFASVADFFGLFSWWSVQYFNPLRLLFEPSPEGAQLQIQVRYTDGDFRIPRFYTARYGNDIK